MRVKKLRTYDDSEGKNLLGKEKKRETFKTR